MGWAMALAVARSGLGVAAAAGENWADSSPLHHHNGCPALASLHAGFHKHGEAARDLFCTYRGDSNLAKVQLNINSKALVAYIDRAV